MRRNPIPKVEARWGAFSMLRDKTDKQIQELLKVILASKTPPGSPEQQVGDLYRSGVNAKLRTKLGISPLSDVLKRIESMTTHKDVVRMFASLERIGCAGIWATYIDQDMLHSDQYVPTITQSGLGMPDRDYYLKDDAESVRVRTAYRHMLERLVTVSRLSKSPADDANAVLTLETAIARAHMTKEDLRDVDKVYHPYTFAKLKKEFASIDWDEYLSTLGIHSKKVIVSQPEFIRAMEALLSSTDLPTWRVYLRTHLLMSYASVLTPALEKILFEFYVTTLAGTKHMRPLPRRILRVVNGALGELLGKVYVERHFPPRAKKTIERVVADLFRAYEARIRGLDWMSSATKRRAIKKLHQMNRKLAYPSRWRSYRGLKIHPNEYAKNFFRIHEHEHRRMVRKLGKKVDRSEWFMTPQTVNAYCSFTLNDIVFPAAILQHPFFNVDADDAFNYGAIGSVIGHEITHAFDDQGSKFDGIGNRKTWWTEQDRKQFEEKASVVTKQFDAYEIEPGMHVNGKLTLGENIADLGGLSIAFDAYQLRLKETGRKDIGGYTPEQRFFLAYAGTEREQERPEYRRTMVMTDPHSPSRFRVNGPLSNLPEFYEAFAVTEKDALYRAPEDRAKVW